MYSKKLDSNIFDFIFHKCTVVLVYPLTRIQDFSNIDFRSFGVDNLWFVPFLRCWSKPNTLCTYIL